MTIHQVVQTMLGGKNRHFRSERAAGHIKALSPNPWSVEESVAQPKSCYNYDIASPGFTPHLVPTSFCMLVSLD
eukprot:6190639-Pleurochrysis_carterae.AAC.2